MKTLKIVIKEPKIARKVFINRIAGRAACHHQIEYSNGVGYKG